MRFPLKIILFRRTFFGNGWLVIIQYGIYFTLRNLADALFSKGRPVFFKSTNQVKDIRKCQTLNIPQSSGDSIKHGVARKNVGFMTDALFYWVNSDINIIITFQ